MLDVGNNNKLSEGDLVTLFELLKDQPRIILVNTAVPRGWRAENDTLISKVALGYPQATVIHWDELSRNHPEFFAHDGVHLNEAGSDVYVAAILEALRQ